ncbi:entericidin A/B family lipoprotein [Hyphomonas sp.]|nr:entericidin [Hyphomonadaceae bacterium]MBA29812.1 entericidin [Hyphomonadaceae bacterium]
MKKLMAAALALSMLPLVSACNTVEGVGRDVQAGGEIVSETARDVKDKMSK